MLTFFRNAMLQCLINTDMLYDYFIQGGHLLNKSNAALSESFAQVLSTAYSKNISVGEMTEVLQNLKHTLEKVAPIFEGYAQNDTHEFFRLLIEKIHDELNASPLSHTNILSLSPQEGTQRIQLL